MDESVFVWWVTLSVITLINVFAWIHSAILVKRRKSELSIADYILSRRILILAGIYVIGCGIRAILPRIDALRISLVDHWLSSILVGRSVATIAELCFIAQWALLLHAIGTHKNEDIVTHIAYWILPIIFIAELFSWSSVITTINFGHVIEESLWTITAFMILICFTRLRNYSDGVSKSLFSVLIVSTIGYILFMLIVDIPMYFTRWQADLEHGRNTLSFADGVRDLSYRLVVIGDWKIWRNEVPWMTLYFSVAVWTSIALTHIPSMQYFRRVEPD